MEIALILVDVINEFFLPEGRNYYHGYFSIFPNIQRLLSSARRNKLTIVHAMEGHLPDHNHDFEWRKLPKHDILGSSEAEPVKGCEPLPGERVVRKRRYSAFFATDLDLYLRELGINCVVIVGVKTNVCVRATAQDAFALGYSVMVVREAVGSNFPHLHEASLEDIDRYMGRVISLDEALVLLEKQGQRN